MKTILQISANGAKNVDIYGDASTDAPEIMLYTYVVWEFDLRSEKRKENGELEKYIPQSDSITNWYFAVDRDFDSSTIPKILITEGITFDVSEDNCILRVTIPQTGTAEMISDMEGAASKKYTAEIGAMDENARIVITWQFTVTVKNRIFAGEYVPLPPEVTYPDYYTAFEVNGLLAGKANVSDVYTKDEIDGMINNLENELAEI